MMSLSEHAQRQLDMKTGSVLDARSEKKQRAADIVDTVIGATGGLFLRKMSIRDAMIVAVAAALPPHRCAICGGRVDLSDAIKPTVRIGGKNDH